MIAHRVRDLGLNLLSHVPAEPLVPSDSAKRILLIRPDHLGDLLFLTPALQRLRRTLPEAYITLAVGPWSEPVVRDNLDLDEIVTIPFPGFNRDRKDSTIEPYRLLIDWSRRLREGAPTAAVILRDDHWWGAWLAQRAGIPLRIGADHPAVRHYLTHPVPLRQSHWAQRNVELVDAAAAMLGGEVLSEPITPESAPARWQVSRGAEEAAQRLLTKHGVEAPYVVLAPGAGAPVKLWPPERWARVASTIAEQFGLAVVFTGAAGEAPLIDRVRVAMSAPSCSLAGQTDLDALAVVLTRARLVVGPDSGPLHLAVAVGTPTVHLYGPSLASAYGPWGDPARHRALSAGWHCPRCGDLSPSRPEGAGCMLALSVECVLGTIRELLTDG